MDSFIQPKCPRCGTSLKIQNVDQLCEACLLKGVLDAQWIDETISDDFTTEAIEGCEVSEEGLPERIGKYQVHRLLGQGGMGKVYEATDMNSGRRVALKLLTLRLDRSKVQERLLREARFAADVSHPNSLFVFGVEEIDGFLVISMEIAAGGTLMDRLKRDGPLPTRDAVDAILNVISGLNAAFDKGVLHRDIKPSNCFINSDGLVQIGDYGLSVSTERRLESSKPHAAGTPAFASPEQLRGMEVDVRSEIYSVGATLYTLLAGKPPFTGPDVPEIVAASLSQEPVPVDILCPDVPPALRKVISKCLEKKPERRFESYDALKVALLPFSTTEEVAAPLGQRFLAGFIDVAIARILPGIVLLAAFGIQIEDRILLEQRDSMQLLSWGVIQSLFVLYYTLMEGLLGAGLGKIFMGLKVVRIGEPSIGIRRAFFRSLIAVLCGNLGVLVGLLAYDGYFGPVIAGIYLTMSLLTYVTMRRSNGWATFWDLVTGTRVVVKPSSSKRLPYQVNQSQETCAVQAEMIGPYRIEKSIIPDQWICATDPVLHRNVWLLKNERPPIQESRRDLSRPGRMRWIQQVDNAKGTLDVFEAFAGVPLTQFMDQFGEISWESMRHWLHDLADEMRFAAKDATLPHHISLAKVWITHTGHAKLLDVPWGPEGDSIVTYPLETHEQRLKFLSAMLQLVPGFTIPLHVRPLMRNLNAGVFEKMGCLVGNLRSLLSKPVEIGRSFRFASLLAVPLFLFLIYFVGSLSLAVRGKPVPGVFPAMDIWSAASQGNVFELNQHKGAGTDFNIPALNQGNVTPLILAAFRGQAAAAETLLRHGADPELKNDDGSTALHIAAFFGHLETVRVLLSHGASLAATNQLGMTPLESIVAPWNDELKEIYLAIEQALKIELDLEYIRNRRPQVVDLLEKSHIQQLPRQDYTAAATQSALLPIARLVCSILVTFISAVQLLSILLVRGTPGQFAFGFCVVDHNGNPVSRVRLLLRWILIWSLPAATLSFNLQVSGGLLALIFMLLWVAGCIFTVLRPQRGIHDMLTGCWLVRR
jgi:eukaryotic-like serine/threonine-protein kinase